MEQSVMDSTKIKQLIQNALTDKINDREMFMKGIDYSYYYEEAEWFLNSQYGKYDNLNHRIIWQKKFFYEAKSKNGRYISIRKGTDKKW